MLATAIPKFGGSGLLRCNCTTWCSWSSPLCNTINVCHGYSKTPDIGNAKGRERNGNAREAALCVEQSMLATVALKHETSGMPRHDDATFGECAAAESSQGLPLAVLSRA
jgi:hypothetical protein